MAIQVSENYPVEVPTYVYAPGLNPYVFYIELAGEPLGALGAIEQEVARVFAEHRVPLLIFKVLRSDGLAKLLVIYADVEGDAVAERLASALGRIPRVVRATYSKPAVRGFAYCERCYPPTVGGERAVIFPRVIYEGLIREGWRKYGTSFPLLLYPLGFEAGRYAYRRCLEVAGGDARAAVGVMEAFFQLLGFGRLEFLRVDDRGMEASYRVYDSFECGLFRGCWRDQEQLRQGCCRGLPRGEVGCQRPRRGCGEGGEVRSQGRPLLRGPSLGGEEEAASPGYGEPAYSDSQGRYPGGGGGHRLGIISPRRCSAP
jgi:hypothetical protein